jgi:hypothetical protein
MEQAVSNVLLGIEITADSPEVAFGKSPEARLD